MSEYAKGSTAALQVAAFLAWALAMAALALLARRAGPRPRRFSRAITVAALALAAAGTVLAAAFATQTVAGELPEDVVRTDAGRLHDLGTLGLFAGLLLAAAASARLLPDRRYRIGVGVLALVLLGTVPLLVALGVDAPGWGQRAFIGVGCAWMILFALRLSHRPMRASTWPARWARAGRPTSPRG